MNDRAPEDDEQKIAEAEVEEFWRTGHGRCLS